MRAVERETPGISEAMRYYSLQITPRAMLSRGVSGIRKEALIVNLPGSPKAVRECLEYAIGALTHGIDILKGNTGNCAGKEKNHEFANNLQIYIKTIRRKMMKK